jgi:muramoyltetrapeptide carboxypeptidase
MAKFSFVDRRKSSAAASTFSSMVASRKAATLKPRSLRPGETVGIVAPASNFVRQDFDTGCDALRGLGYNVVFEDSVFDRDLYFAGSAERRARELEAMFVRKDVKAVLCARGGYGANYLLPLLDINKIAANPKAFVGYSDITSLMTYLNQAAGLVTFHGPMVAKDFAKEDGIDPGSWAAVFGACDPNFNFAANSAMQVLVPGSAEGLLYGGCLSMLAASLGTPYEICTENAVLFIEDVAAKPYQIDRMLMQLKLAGKFAEVRGIIFGEMFDCVQAGNQPYTLEDVIMRIVGDLGVPIAYGLRSGHVSRSNVTLPMGVGARLQAGTSGVNLAITESPTI